MSVNEQLAILSLKQQEINLNIHQLNSFVKRTRINVSECKENCKLTNSYIAELHGRKA
jgi:hypothetical protein